MESTASHSQSGLPRLVLASGSPRRRDLLLGLGLQFEIIPSEIDESFDASDPEEVVKQLSLAKAVPVARRFQSSTRRTLVLGADTIVVLDGEILGKPESRQDACRILGKLSGRRHQVFTGVTIIEACSGDHTSIHQQSDVFFRELNESEIEHYAGTPEPMDKAGAYALQGIASGFVRRIEGCYTNIIGLPVPDTVALLRRYGVPVLGMK